MPAAGRSPVFVITSTGKVRVSKKLKGRCPTQAQLSEFVDAHRERITSLNITVENYEKERQSLNFEDIGILPSLKSLELNVVRLEAIVFKSTNTPALESLQLVEITCPHEDGPRFELELPKLRALDIQHTWMDGPSDFGLSLSRCPMLEVVTTHKLWGLRGNNFTVLPNCRQLWMNRSEGTSCLEVLHAPYLFDLSVRCAYEMSRLALWDVPYEMDAKDVERLNKDLDEEEKKIDRELEQWVAKWKNGVFNGKDAIEHGWIKEAEIEDFNFMKREDIHGRVNYHLNQQFRKRFDEAKNTVVKRLVEEIGSSRPVACPPMLLPPCQVNCINTFVTKECRDQLQANQRVTLHADSDEDMF